MLKYWKCSFWEGHKVTIIIASTSIQQVIDVLVNILSCEDWRKGKIKNPKFFIRDIIMHIEAAKKLVINY
jgi:hypothetical protein